MTILAGPILRSEPRINFSELVCSLSYALDITEGQPEGHAARTCLIGMRMAREMNLMPEEQSALFYGLLLKDLGCSSNASKVCNLFGADDRQLKSEMKVTNWTQKFDSVKYIARNAARGGSLWEKVSRIAAVAKEGPGTACDLIRTRCTRGADIARHLLLPELTAQAIHSLDEHWDGHGFPEGLRGSNIPMLARIMSLAQTAEVYWNQSGVDAACEVASDRSGTWFDPELVKIFLTLRNDSELQIGMRSHDPIATAVALEPEGFCLPATDEILDRLAVGFSEVVDAKSPWTYEHSRGVAVLSEGLGRMFDLPGDRLRKLRWAALLHDIGKLGVSNLILDKPGKLTDEEMTAMRRHTNYTHEILRRVQVFSEFADMAAAHHERLDGTGYHKGLAGDELSLEVRILGVADMYEALAAKRPYREERTKEEALTIIARESGRGLCPLVSAALRTFLAESKFVPYQVAA